MALAVRVIPCLDVDKGRVVKGLRFENLKDAGDPVEAATRYEADGADEVTFLDISAAHERRGTLLHVVQEVAEVLSIPFTVGGGVRSVDDAHALLKAGADRVALNTAAVNDPGLITRIAERFGSQCVVVAVDSVRAPSGDGSSRMLTTTHGGRKLTDREVGAWVAEAAERGAGEILLTSVDADGTHDGFDVPMLRRAREATDIPIVASGGAGRTDHFVKAVLEGGADAVLGASVFHHRLLTIGEVKRAMSAAGIPVRPSFESPGFRVQYDENGLVPVVVRDAEKGDVLMLAYANAEAIARTRETRFAHFYSRSRQELWKKGKSSGNLQRVAAISIDCDNDAVLYDVVPHGPACHTGRRSCFTKTETLFELAASPSGGWKKTPEPPTPPPPALAPQPGTSGALEIASLFEVVRSRRAKPEPGSYTNRLLNDGVARIAKKVGEEAVETVLAAVSEDDDALAGETADLLYHLVVLLVARGLDPEMVQRKLVERRSAPRPKE